MQKLGLLAAGSEKIKKFSKTSQLCDEYFSIFTREIEKIKKVSFNKKHSLLGYPLISVTKINSGTVHNIIPDKCEFLLDIRTTPFWNNKKIIEIIKNTISSVINHVYEFEASETSEKSKIVKIAEKVYNSSSKGFLALSEMALLDCPAIILGPGSLEQAHKPNEYIEIKQYKKAKEIYKKIILDYLK